MYKQRVLTRLFIVSPRGSAVILSAPGLENTGAFVRLGLFLFLPDLPPSYHPQAKRPTVCSSGLGGQRKRLKRRGSWK